MEKMYLPLVIMGTVKSQKNNNMDKPGILKKTQKNTEMAAQACFGF